MHSPKTRTNADGFRLVIDKLGTKTALADGLGVVKQLVSRWEEIPPRHLEAVCKLTRLHVEQVVPEFWQEFMKTVLDTPNDEEMVFKLIRLLVK